MSRFLILSFLFFCQAPTLFGQSKNVDIYYFRNINNIEKEWIGDIEKTLKKKFKGSYHINLINFYAPKKYLPLPKFSINNISQGIVNENYYDIADVQEKIQSLLTNSNKYHYKACVTFSKDREFKVDSKESTKDLIDSKQKKKLKKELKKKKNKNVFILLNNGFEKCQFCPENIQNLFDKYYKSNNLNLLKPKFKNPYLGEMLRPNGTPSKYEIIFDHIKGFDRYEIEITSSSLSTPLVKEVLEFSTEEIDLYANFSMKKSFDGKFVSIYLRDENIGMQCFKRQENINADDVDDDCDCIYQCLYQKKFNIRVRGVSKHLTSGNDLIWSDSIEFLFQCSK